MRHNAKVRHFGRKQGPRRALLKGLVGALVENGRIKTTLAKAKELRRHVEKAITTGKKQTLHARRLLLARYPSEKVVATIMDDLAKRFESRPGGYTRVLKLGARPGDRAEMAYIQFVDFSPKVETAAEKTATAKKKSKVKAKASKAADAADSADSSEENQQPKLNIAPEKLQATQAKKRRVRKAQRAARRVQRINRKH